jgi:hypothetical protein
MNEKTVLKRSVLVFFIGCLILTIVGLLIKDMSYVVGLILGYVINVFVFLLIMKISEGILKYKMSTVMIMVMTILKLLLYAVGFYISVKVDFVHIFGVFLGYFVIKITIYLEGYIHKGGEVDGR